MSQPDRFEAADLRCDACQSNTDIYGIMKTHNKGRWVKWDDYAALAAENERLKERVAFLEAADRFKIWNEKTGEWETRFSISTNEKPSQ